MNKIVKNYRTYGSAPYTVAVVHGGPGAAGEMAPVARELSCARGILEPLQTAVTLEGQVDELSITLESYAALPVILIGFSYGAWLSYIVAARCPELVRKLILISSGPFEESYVNQIEAIRWQRFNRQEQEEWQAINKALSDPVARDKDALLVRMGLLASIADTYDPILNACEAYDMISTKGDIFQSVWTTAAEWRRNGRLLKLGHDILCPVVALHGDYDPHPAAGVREPLAEILKDFRFVLLKNCGHKPWFEKEARGAFYEAIQSELA